MYTNYVRPSSHAHRPAPDRTHMTRTRTPAHVPAHMYTYIVRESTIHTMCVYSYLRS